MFEMTLIDLAQESGFKTRYKRKRQNVWNYKDLTNVSSASILQAPPGRASDGETWRVVEVTLLKPCTQMI